MTLIATHPELNRIALRQSLDLPYMVWAILRQNTTETNGSNHYTKSDVRNLSAKHGLSFTKRHWKRILQRGEGLFWGIGYGAVHVRSFKRVYFSLADSNAAHVDNTSFIEIIPHKNTSLRRATLYHSWFVHRGEVTISRATLTDLFGLSADQQRAYESILGDMLLVKSNYCHIDTKLYQDNPRELPTHAYTFSSEKFENDTVFNREEIAYQLPNTYIASAEHGGVSPVCAAPRRALQVARTLYGNTLHSYNTRRYCKHIDLYNVELGLDVYVRTYYQGKKRINRIGHYL